ncbi:MAG: plasma-membrane proton-efflux P-type ATPase [Verrucomicrobiota bacterium]|nr:plasma-membrane proton-efflux P-type ATPase [Verrucomicrobiota bacterium]
MDPSDLYQKTIEELFHTLGTSANGLSSSEAGRRQEQFGPNAIEEKEGSPLLKLLFYFWGPIPWMIEIAALLSFFLRHFADCILISSLLFINGLIRYFEEKQAGNALQALRRNLALRALVKRDGTWQEIEATLLVPGDIIRLRIGNLIPADAKLISEGALSVDQSTVTGESLPVSKEKGDLLYSGSVVKRGEMEALIVATGKKSFMGKTAELVLKAGAPSHFQRAVLQIGKFLILLSLSLVFLIIAIQLSRGESFFIIAEFVLVLLIASIPVALPAILSVTMALGALRLSRMQALVTKLESIEEMAGIDTLCSDKTGTLTENRLQWIDTFLSPSATKEELSTAAAGSCRKEDKDPIDLAILEYAKEPRQIRFTPFDPTAKRASGTILTEEQREVEVTKGAPQVVLTLSQPGKEERATMERRIDLWAEKGYRTLGVARKENEQWKLLGLIALADPLRADAKETIARAKEHGITIKMVTGDHSAIAKDTLENLGLGTKIITAAGLQETEIEKIDGFAEVVPEHKLQIVDALQKRGHLVGMTGDGVNDAPALKQADVGIAVHPSTDAARAAAALVLTKPGLSVIIKAIEEARCIFERMQSYAIYRIAETVRIIFFITSCILIYNFYPITPLMIIMLALLNDIPLLSIAYDNTSIDQNPVRWKMQQIIIIAALLGALGVIESFLLLFLLKSFTSLTLSALQSAFFLKLSVAGHQTLFVARTKNAFYRPPYPSLILLIAILATQTVAALITGFGLLITALPWHLIGLIWIYTLTWIFFIDRLKILTWKKIVDTP